MDLPEVIVVKKEPSSPGNEAGYELWTVTRNDDSPVSSPRADQSHLEADQSVSEVEQSGLEAGQSGLEVEQSVEVAHPSALGTDPSDLGVDPSAIGMVKSNKWADQSEGVSPPQLTGTTTYNLQVQMMIAKSIRKKVTQDSSNIPEAFFPTLNTDVPVSSSSSCGLYSTKYPTLKQHLSDANPNKMTYLSIDKGSLEFKNVAEQISRSQSLTEENIFDLSKSALSKLKTSTAKLLIQSQSLPKDAQLNIIKLLLKSHTVSKEEKVNVTQMLFENHALSEDEMMNITKLLLESQSLPQEMQININEFFSKGHTVSEEEKVNIAQLLLKIYFLSGKEKINITKLLLQSQSVPEEMQIHITNLLLKNQALSKEDQFNFTKLLSKEEQTSPEENSQPKHISASKHMTVANLLQIRKIISMHKTAENLLAKRKQISKHSRASNLLQTCVVTSASLPQQPCESTSTYRHTTASISPESCVVTSTCSLISNPPQSGVVTSRFGSVLTIPSAVMTTTCSSCNLGSNASNTARSAPGYIGTDGLFGLVVGSCISNMETDMLKQCICKVSAERDVSCTSGHLSESETNYDSANGTVVNGTVNVHNICDSLADKVDLKVIMDEELIATEFKKENDSTVNKLDICDISVEDENQTVIGDQELNEMKRENDTCSIFNENEDLIVISDENEVKKEIDEIVTEHDICDNMADMDGPIVVRDEVNIEVKKEIDSTDNDQNRCANPANVESTTVVRDQEYTEMKKENDSTNNEQEICDNLADMEEDLTNVIKDIDVEKENDSIVNEQEICDEGIPTAAEVKKVYKYRQEISQTKNLPKWKYSIIKRDKLNVMLLKRFDQLRKCGKNPVDSDVFKYRFFSCYLCPFVTSDKHDGYNHILETHIDPANEKQSLTSGTNFKCTHCPRVFKSMNLLKNHEVRIHLSEFPCYFCGKPNTTCEELLHHICSSHSEVYKCHCGCGESFIGKHSFLQHLNHKKHYQKLMSFSCMCLYCGDRFDDFMTLKSHMARNHIFSPVPNSEEQTCISCRHVFMDLKALKNHENWNSDSLSTCNMQTIAEIQKHINALACKTEVSEYDDENMNIHAAELTDHRRWWIDHLEKHKNSIRSVNLYTNDSMTKYSYPHGELLKTCQVGDLRVDPVSIRAIDILIYQLVLLMLTRFGQEAKQRRLCLTHSVREKLLYVFNSREYVKILNRLGMVGKLQIFCDNQNDDDKMADIQMKGRVYQYPINLGLKYCCDTAELYGIIEDVIPVVILFVFLDFPHLKPSRCLHSHDFWKMVAMVCRIPLCTLFMQTIHTEPLAWQPFLENYSEQFVISCLKSTLDFGDINAWPAFASTKLSGEYLAIPSDTTDEAFVTYALMKPIATQMFHLVARHQMNCLTLCLKQYKTLRNEYNSRKLFKYNGEHMPSKTNECESLENSERHEEHLTDVLNPSEKVKLGYDNITNELESKSTSHERHAALRSMDNGVVQHIHSEETNDTIKIEIDIDDVQTEIDPEHPQVKSQSLTEDQFEIKHPEIESQSLTENQFEIEHYMNDMQTDIDFEHPKTKSEGFTEDEFKIDLDDVQNESNSEQCELKRQSLSEEPIKIEIDTDDVPYEFGMEQFGIRSQSLTEPPIKIELDIDDVPDMADDDFECTMANNVTKVTRNLKRKYEGGVFNETEESVGDMKGYSKVRKVDYDDKINSTVDTRTKLPHSVKNIKESFVLLERNAVAEALVLEHRPSRIKKEVEENLTEQHQSTCNISKVNSVQCLKLDCSDNGSNGKLAENEQSKNCNEIFVEILKVSNSVTVNEISTSSLKTENKNSPINPDTKYSNSNSSPKKSLRPRKQKVCYYESDSEAMDENSDNEMSLVINTDDSDSNDPNYNDLDDGLDSDSEGSDEVKGNADATYKLNPVANVCATISPSVPQDSSDLSTSSGNIPVFCPWKETSATNTSHDSMNNVKAMLWNKIKSAVSSRDSTKLCIDSKLLSTGHSPELKATCGPTIYIPSTSGDHIPQSDMSQSDKVPINYQFNNVDHIPQSDMSQSNQTPINNQLNNVDHIPQSDMSQLDKVPINNHLNNVDHIPQSDMSQSDKVPINNHLNNVDHIPPGNDEVNADATYKQNPLANVCVSISPAVPQSYVSLCKVKSEPVRNLDSPATASSAVHALYKKIKSEPCNIFIPQQIVRPPTSLLGLKPLARKIMPPSQKIVRPPTSPLGSKSLAPKNVPPSQQIVRPPFSLLGLKPLARKKRLPSQQIVRPPHSPLGFKPLAPKKMPPSQQIVRHPRSLLGLKPLAPKNVPKMIPKTVQNPGIPLTVQNIDFKKTEKNSGISEVTQNSGIPKVTQNSGIPKVTQNSGIPKVTQNSGISKVTQNSGLPKVTQNSGKQQTSYNPRITQIFQTPYGIVVVFGRLTEEAQIGFIDLVKNLFIMGQKAQNSTGLRLTVQNQTNILQSVQNLTGVTNPIKISQPAKILPRTLLLAQNSFSVPQMAQISTGVPQKDQNSTDVSQIAQNSTSEPQMDSNQISLIEFMSKSSVSGQIPAIVIDGQLNLPEGIFYAQIAIMSTFKMILIPFHDQSTTGHINTSSQPPLLSTSVSSVAKANSVYSTAKGIANQDILSIAMSEINEDNIDSTEMALPKIVSSADPTLHDTCINEPQPVRIKQEPGLETPSAGSLSESSDKHSQGHVISVVSSSYDPINNVKVMVWDKIKSAVNSRDSPKEPGSLSSPMNNVKAKLWDKIKSAVSSRDSIKEPGPLGSSKLCIDSTLLSTGQSPKLKATCGPTIYIPPTSGDHIQPTDMSQSDKVPINNQLNNVDRKPQSDMSQSDKVPIHSQLNNVDHIPQSDMSQSDKVPINNQLNNVDHIPQSDMSQSDKVPINNQLNNVDHTPQSDMSQSDKVPINNQLNNVDHIPQSDMSQSDKVPINNQLNNVDHIPQSDMSQSDKVPINNQLNNVDRIPQSDMSQSDKVPINNQLNNVDHTPQSDMSQSDQTRSDMSQLDETPINYLCMSDEDEDDITIISLKMEPDEPTEYTKMNDDE